MLTTSGTGNGNGPDRQKQHPKLVFNKIDENCMGKSTKEGIWVVATQIFFIFTNKPGEMIQFDEHIFQMG